MPNLIVSLEALEVEAADLMRQEKYSEAGSKLRELHERFLDLFGSEGAFTRAAIIVLQSHARRLLSMKRLHAYRSAVILLQSHARRLIATGMRCMASAAASAYASLATVGGSTSVAGRTVTTAVAFSSLVAHKHAEDAESACTSLLGAESRVQWNELLDEWMTLLGDVTAFVSAETEPEQHCVRWGELLAVWTELLDSATEVVALHEVRHGDQRSYHSVQ
jgi:hypothetical protein